ETVYKEWDDRMERAATTASSLDAEQDSGSGPRCQNTILGGADAQIMFEIASKQSNDPPLSRGYTLGSGEDSMQLMKLMELCKKLSDLIEKWKNCNATIDGQLKTITEASLRRHLKLEDADGISSLPNTEIFEQLALMGPKKTYWEQFSSNIVTAIICLATNRSFNFSKMIFEGMGEGSTVLVVSHHTPIPTPSTSHPPTSTPSMHIIHDTEEPATMPHDSSHPRVQSLRHDEGSLTHNELTVLYTTLSKKVEDFQSDLKQTKLTYGAAYTKLIVRVKKLEHKVKSRQPRRMARVVISDTKEDLEDPSKHGRRIIQGRTSADTEILLDQEEPTKLVEDLGSGEKGEKEISTASATPEKKSKKQLEQERLRHKEAIRLQEQINEEERQRISRDAEIAKQLQEEFNRARQEQKVVAKVDQAYDIDWSDPAMLRYHALQNRSFSIAEDSEIEKEVMKRPGFDFQQKSIKKNDKIKAS
ncbi:hypothetical protein Tco_1013508, partial [Tanacetum coccineum]